MGIIYKNIIIAGDKGEREVNALFDSGASALKTTSEINP